MTVTLGTIVTRQDGFLHRSFVQTVIGTDTLIVDPVDGRVTVKELVLTLAAAGTVALGLNISPAMNLTAGTPLKLTDLELAESEALTATTVGAGAFIQGYVVYKVLT
jgi:hypothetical protein